jgi:hypothetical protein
VVKEKRGEKKNEREYALVESAELPQRHIGNRGIPDTSARKRSRKD